MAATQIGTVNVGPGLPGGVTAALNITAPYVVKAAPGILCTIVCVVAGSIQVNDLAATSGAAAANEIWAGSLTAGQVLTLNWPCATGIALTTVTTAQVNVSYS